MTLIASFLIFGWLAYLILPLVFMCAIAIIMYPICVWDDARRRRENARKWAEEKQARMDKGWGF